MYVRKPGSSPLMGVVEFLNTLATNFADSKYVKLFLTYILGNKCVLQAKGKIHGDFEQRYNSLLETAIKLSVG